MAFRALFAGKNHAQIYKTFRPNYSEELFADIFKIVSPWIDKTDFTVAVDVGCGSGQASEYLSSRFDCVFGIDPSFSQLEEAKSSEVCSINGDFMVGSSERIPLKDESCCYVQAFEAAHWFNLPIFYKEVDRILKPGGVLLFAVYANVYLDPECNKEIATIFGFEVFPRFNQDICAFRNHLIENGCISGDIMKVIQSLYRDLELPYSEKIRNVDLKLKERWTVERFVAYLKTWSGWQQYIAKTDDTAYLLNLETKWKNTFGDETLEFTWPMGLLVSRKPF